MIIANRKLSVEIIQSFLILLPILLFGCSSMEVNNNKFISTRHPYLEAKISPELKYLSHYKINEERLSNDKKTSFKIISDSFFFIPNEITRGLLPQYAYVLIEEIPNGRFVQPFLSYNSVVTERNIAQLGWYDFATITQVVVPDIKVDKRLQNLIEQGFKMPKCVLKRSVGRVVSYEQRYIILVYGEDASLSGYSCEKWKDLKKLTEEQKEYITEFDKRAMSAIEIVASD